MESSSSPSGSVRAGARGKTYPPPSAAEAGDESPENGDAPFIRRVLVVTGLVLGAAAVVGIILYATEVLLVLFASILLAIALRAPTNWLSNHTLLTEKTALAVSIGVLVAIIGLLAWLFALPMSEQASQLLQTIPEALGRMRAWIENFPWGKPMVALLREGQHDQIQRLMLGAKGVLSSTAHGIAGFVLIVFLGFYLAAQPRLYQRGFLRLFPPHLRTTALEVLDEIGSVLRRWLIARGIVMVVVGTAAGFGLWMLDIPLAFALGVLTGLIEFIPYLGPILSAVPSVLVAFNVAPAAAAYVVLLYVVVQSAEGYLLSPIIEQRTVSLPPALVIFDTALLGALAGVLGIVFASPLTAVFIVAVRKLYMEPVVEHSRAQ